MLMPGLDSSPNDPVWTDFANFRLFSNRQALHYFALVFRFHFHGKLEENLATLGTCVDKKIKQVGAPFLGITIVR